MTLAQPVTVPRQPSVAERKKGGGGVVSGGAAGGNAVVQGVADALAPLGLQLTPVRGGGSSFNRGGLGRDFDARVVVCPRGGVAVARGAGREVVMRVQLDSAKVCACVRRDSRLFGRLGAARLSVRGIRHLAGQRHASQTHVMQHHGALSHGGCSL